MFDFRTTTPIRATPEKVWALLTDAAAYPTWNPTIEKVEGAIAPGGKITVYAQVAKGKGFPVKVVVFDAPKTMVWRGGAPLKFMFKGERRFELVPGDGGVTFTMHEVFSGFMSGLIKVAMPDLQPTFDAFAAALKAAAEKA